MERGVAEETATTVGPGEAGKAGKAKRGFLWRFARAVVVGNLGLVAVIACGAFAAHTYATSSEERFQGVVAFATQYVLVPASLVEDHGFNHETGERVARLVEGLVIDGAGRGPRTDAHRYFQARVLLAMPAVYKTFGRTQERVERAERSIAMFADLVARNPANTDYRRTSR